MKTGDIINFLETVAPSGLQEEYDNAGLIYGSADTDCTGILVSLDVTDDVIEEAVRLGCNLIISHHPLIFRGLKKLNTQQPVGRMLVNAIRSGIMIYAIHTNLDNAWDGVSFRIADLLNLQKRSILDPKKNVLRKLITYTPVDHLEKLREALFAAGGGHIGDYDECSFSSEGKGTFKAGPGTDPFVGEQGVRHEEPEARLELVFPAFHEKGIIRALFRFHPYEEPAFDILKLENEFSRAGSGLVGELTESRTAESVFAEIRKQFRVPVIRHSPFTGKKISTVALCGGAGSFLIPKALAAGADLFLTADLKYHDFFEADGKIILADIGHYESEQFTSDLLVDLLIQKFPNFAVLKTGVDTNPVNYFL